MDENAISRSVFDEALKLLNDVPKWKKNIKYGVPCDLNASSLSLGCAMEKALIEIKGEYQNRGREMGALRRTIYRHYLWRAGIHPVTYFNRHKKTSYFDVIDILKKARKKFEN